MQNYHHRLTRQLSSGALLGVACLLSACASLPKDGPLRAEVVSEARQKSASPFTLIKVSDKTLGVLEAVQVDGFFKTFGDSPATELRFGVGDGVSLVVFEAGSEPLFSNGVTSSTASSASRAVNLPGQTVALDGTVLVPFAGRIQAAGLSAQELELAVEKALAGRASHPQIVATASYAASGAVTVLGDLGPGSRIPLSAYGERLLDVLAGSGGLRGSVFDTWVELRRGASSLRLPMSAIIRDPKENVRLHPGDIVLLTHQPKTFTAFGATGHSALIEFGAEHVALTDAVAKAGGLQDGRADPLGVFLFRYEPTSVVKSMGATPQLGSVETAVVYQFDFLHASSYFISRRFALKDGDVLYVASSPTRELEKFLQLLGLVTQPVLSGVAVNSAIK